VRHALQWCWLAPCRRQPVLLWCECDHLVQLACQRCAGLRGVVEPPCLCPSRVRAYVANIVCTSKCVCEHGSPLSDRGGYVRRAARSCELWAVMSRTLGSCWSQRGLRICERGGCMHALGDCSLWLLRVAAIEEARRCSARPSRAPLFVYCLLTHPPVPLVYSCVLVHRHDKPSARWSLCAFRVP